MYYLKGLLGRLNSNVKEFSVVLAAHHGFDIYSFLVLEFSPIPVWFCFVVLGIEPRASSLLGKLLPLEPCPQPFYFDFDIGSC
jgi:hypothetical protein